MGRKKEAEGRADPEPAQHRQDGRLLPAFDCLPEEASALSVRRNSSSSGGLEFTRLEKGLYLLVFDVQLDAPVRQPIVGEDLIEFHYRVQGSLGIKGSWGEIRMARPGMLMWWQPEGHDDAFETIGQEGGGPERSLSIYCSHEWLENVSEGEVAILDLLKEIRKDEAEPVFRILPNQPETAAAVEAILRNPLSGRLRFLRAKARVLDLLSLSLDALIRVPPGRENETLRFSERDMAALSQAQDILRDEFVAPPSVATLAKRVGLNASKFIAGFRREFGETPHHYVRRLRLERAQELLATTDLQIGQVAEAVGYAHHSTFTTAYSDYFGIAPKMVVAARHVYGRGKS